MPSARLSGEAPIRVWCLLCDQFGHVQPAEAHLGPAATFTYDAEWDPEKLLRAAPDVVLCVNEFYSGVTRCLIAAQEAAIPTLTVQDGILEWRCQYENPLFGAGGGSPQHQPVFADKIACIGRQSARQIERWGNPGKGEVVGMPRLDHLLARPRRVPARNERVARLLVMTAKKAGFTPEQMAITLCSLRDVAEHLQGRPEIELRWRVSRDCEPGALQAMAIENRMGQPDSRELAAVLDEVDAVITTPSTAMLEAMLMGKPVAALDYHNTPRFVPSAWTISAAAHIPAVVEEILEPPARKLAFQEDCLHEALECHSPAAPRLGALLLAMARAGREARAAGRPLELLPGLVPVDGASPSGGPELAALYPEAGLFQENDLARLKVRLARAEHENARLQKRLKSQSLAMKTAAAIKARLLK
jgi:hypothetical protein